MHTSNYWVAHFKENARHKRINWNLTPTITADEVDVVLPSLQAWQLGETSEGRQLIAVSTRYANTIGDPEYLEAIKLFIKEEQKHGNNLGRYIDKIGKPRLKRNWGDSVFRYVRHFNASMEMWTLTVITVESAAQIFYQSLKDATGCRLLKQVCTDILIDEAYHITFQTERLETIYNSTSSFGRAARAFAYRYFFYATACVVWFAHKNLFKAGGNTFESYVKKMRYKQHKTIAIITNAGIKQAKANYANSI